VIEVEEVAEVGQKYLRLDYVLQVGSRRPKCLSQVF
jgi:hypothetical protein